MSDSPFQSPRSPRRRHLGIVIALAAAVVCGRAAVSQQTPPAAPPTAPTQAKPVGDSAAAPDSTAMAVQVADSLAVPDSLAPTTADSIQSTPLVAAAPAAPATWPVDPATGQTVINGRPVVGRVFIMQKTDGTVKYPNVADVVSHEALAPLPAVVGTSYIPAPLALQRRHRGIMVQATLWSMDSKRSATRLRNYPVSTPANELGK
ncbi:hypothetical protein [Gemmatimonas sp.]|uniref:hypothetical protein n=1 Tax=Gemmatimonas sp. TaxID=1962908 RepID=UPI003DA3C936